MRFHLTIGDSLVLISDDSGQIASAEVLELEDVEFGPSGITAAIRSSWGLQVEEHVSNDTRLHLGTCRAFRYSRTAERLSRLDNSFWSYRSKRQVVRASRVWFDNGVIAATGVEHE